MRRGNRHPHEARRREVLDVVPGIFLARVPARGALGESAVGQLAEFQVGRHLRGQVEEVGPDAAVEQVAAEAVEDGGGAVDGHAVAGAVVHLVDEDRQRADVVDVRVGDEHVADGGLVGDGAVQAEAAGVHGQRTVNDEGGQELVPGAAAVGRRRDDEDSHDSAIARGTGRRVGMGPS